MAVVSPSSPETLDPKSNKPDPSSENPNPNPDPTPLQTENPNADPFNSTPTPTPNPNPNADPSNPTPTPTPTPTPNPNHNLVTPPPPSFAPSFRPLGVTPMPQYTTIPNPIPCMNFSHNPSPGVQPPGVSAPFSYMIPGMASGAGLATVSGPPMRYQPPNAPPMVYGQVPNGYMSLPPGVPPPALSW